MWYFQLPDSSSVVKLIVPYLTERQQVWQISFNAALTPHGVFIMPEYLIQLPQVKMNIIILFSPIIGFKKLNITTDLRKT